MINGFPNLTKNFNFFLFYSTLNNNNITRLSVASFNHMPKLRTL